MQSYGTDRMHNVNENNPRKSFAENPSGLTVHIGVLVFIFILILAPSVPEQDLSLFGRGLGGGLSHLPGLPAHLLILIALICPGDRRQTGVKKTETKPQAS